MVAATHGLKTERANESLASSSPGSHWGAVGVLPRCWFRYALTTRLAWVDPESSLHRCTQELALLFPAVAVLATPHGDDVRSCPDRGPGPAFALAADRALIAQTTNLVRCVIAQRDAKRQQGFASMQQGSEMSKNKVADDLSLPLAERARRAAGAWKGHGNAGKKWVEPAEYARKMEKKRNRKWLERMREREAKRQ